MAATSEPLYPFPRTARLLRAAEFERVLRYPDLRLRNGPLRLNVVFTRMHGVQEPEGALLEKARLGLIVGKKAVPQAHARNRIKRVVRDRFRRARLALGCADIVVQVSGPVTRVELHRCLDALFDEVHEHHEKQMKSGRR